MHLTNETRRLALLQRRLEALLDALLLEVETVVVLWCGRMAVRIREKRGKAIRRGSEDVGRRRGRPRSLGDGRAGGEGREERAYGDVFLDFLAGNTRVLASNGGRSATSALIRQRVAEGNVDVPSEGVDRVLGIEGRRVGRMSTSAVSTRPNERALTSTMETQSGLYLGAVVLSSQMCCCRGKEESFISRWEGPWRDAEGTYRPVWVV